MKTMFFSSILYFLIVLVSGSTVIANNFGGGSGTPDDPYKVETADHLDRVRDFPDKSFKQVEDIDLSGVNWTPIGNSDNPFTGNYDGNGYIISSLTIKRRDFNSIGLFGYIQGAKLENICLENVEVEGRTEVGGLAGSSKSNSSIYRSYVTGIIDGSGGRVGGIVGYNENSTLAQCYTEGTVKGELDRIGGLAGYNDGGSIQNSYSLSKVTGRNTVGGLAGMNEEGTISHCFAAGKVSAHQGSPYKGGLVGRNLEGEVEKSYYDREMAGMDDEGKGAPKSTQEMMREETFEDWNFDENWRIIEDKTYPYLNWQILEAGFKAEPQKGYVPLTVQFSDESKGIIESWKWDFGDGNTSDESEPVHEYTDVGRYTVSLTIFGLLGSDTKVAADYITVIDFAGGTGEENDPYLVETAEQLHNVRLLPDSHYRQEANINLSDFNNGNWEPIGVFIEQDHEDNEPFTGSYDGNGYLIRNLTVDSVNRSIGLFGHISGAALKHLFLEDVEVHGDKYVGGLVGYQESGKIYASYVKGTVSGGNNVGGMVGCNGDGNILSSYTEISVSGESNVGGLVGKNAGIIENCYAMVQDGNLVSGDNSVGGLTGKNTGEIRYCYATGSVTGDTEAGGLVGLNENGEVQDSYYDRETTGQSDTGKGIPETTEQMKWEATFTNWDFEGIWIIIDAGEDYPVLQWEVLIAGFSADPTEGPLNVNVNFTDESVGHIEKWEWDFGDGNTSVEPNPVHEYTEAGQYTVSLTVSGLLGSAAQEKEDYITVINFAGGSGDVNDPYLVEKASQFDNVRNHLDKHFTQVADISLADFKNEEGWKPIGVFIEPDHEDNIPFTGSYDGNGHLISNLTIDIDDKGAGLFGYTHNAMLKNLFLKNVTVTGRTYTGALVGYMQSGDIRNCYITGNIAGDNYVGGLVGYSDNNSTIEESCYAGKVEGRNKVGGFAGFSAGNVIDSYAFADVKGKEKVGGFTGQNDGNIMKCYAMDKTGVLVTGESYVGGFAGKNTGEIRYCYATGSVTGDTEAGGLVGLNDNGEVQDSYYDRETTGQSDTGKGIPETTEQMKREATFAGWDFVEKWSIVEEKSYPYLQWEEDHFAQADFTADRLSVPVGRKVRFTDVSTGIILSRQWDFGDGRTSTAKNPAHSYSEPGIYTITLTVHGLRESHTLKRHSFIHVSAVELARDTRTFIARSMSYMRSSPAFRVFRSRSRALNADHSLPGVTESLPAEQNDNSASSKDALYDVSFQSSTFPSLLTRGIQYLVELTVKNTGHKTWKAEDSIYLVAVDDYDDLAPESFWRLKIEEDVLPGEAYTFYINLQAEKVGTFTTAWRLLKMNHFWIGEIFQQEVRVVESMLAFNELPD